MADTVLTERRGREEAADPRRLSSGAAKEGPRAFAEKRAPVWSGR
jgi:hypothetical protein